MNEKSNNLDMVKVKFWTLASLLIGSVFLYANFKDWTPNDDPDKVRYEVAGRWELPTELKEISAIDWVDENSIAAVQDEDGIIFIYDLLKKKVVQKIEFGGAGDYEGLAVDDNNAYVLESNGRISIIQNYKNEDRTLTEYHTLFSTKNDMESLELDNEHDRLLVIPKERGVDSDRYKGVYAFSLKDWELDEKPIFKIDMTDEVLDRYRKKKIQKTFRPSDMAIHPQTKEIYLLDGAHPKMLILDKNGKTKNVYTLNETLFPQPEGITFSPNGTLYISSEGEKNGVGTITELQPHTTLVKR
ncbi:SdiA-regulated domain-containing protein [Maribacter sp. MMG018]|uniref:SdiA-regulated domain-containing protein n=1 Tax=Maribacter sp. MMG018 TaxID=2822688 RepID=UPI001B37A880|nr:SdiA-regulated domain-containing protein [Maribacter sp. MMG018]MBQ4913327.1 SdiA-regulated domain-containing protein [Maribacter sp. MMG018]